MYVNNIKIKNYGSIEEIEINASLNEDGSPKPIIIMGKNGSGKTLLLSQIIQAILLYKSDKYNEMPEKDKNQLYKVMSTSYIKNDKEESFVSVSFNNKKYNYVEVMSKNPNSTIENNSYPDYTSKLRNNTDFKEIGMYNDKTGELDYDKSVCLYFPVDRHYIPGWKNNNLKSNIGAENKIIGINTRNVLCNTIQNDFEGFIINSVVDQYLYDQKIFLKNGERFLTDSVGNPIINYIGKNNSIINFINSILSEFKNDKYKIDLIERMPEDENISCYTQGDYTDLCRGPHVESVKECKYFKLLKFSGAYWKGDSNNKMLQRIYGVCFRSEEDLNRHLEELEEAKQRDHRKLGKDLKIFMLSDLVGRGLPLWLPNGYTLWRTLQNYITDKEVAHGYKHVHTPDLGSVELYKTSGHWDHYKDDMFPAMELDEEAYVLRPMNCPHHMVIYGNGLHSYRDLPIRIAEVANDFRYENSGAVCGLERVRQMCQNDAHLFVRPDQIKEEFGITIKPIKKLYEMKSEKFNQKEIFFLCEYIEGEFGTGDGPEFNNDPKYIDSGEYLPEIIKESEIKNLLLLPTEIKEKFVEDLENGRI